MWVQSYKLPAAGGVLVFGSSFMLALAFPALFQRIYVKPNELRLETPYLQRNIALTRGRQASLSKTPKMVQRASASLLWVSSVRGCFSFDL